MKRIEANKRKRKEKQSNFSVKNFDFAEKFKVSPLIADQRQSKPFLAAFGGTVVHIMRCFLHGSCVNARFRK